MSQLEFAIVDLETTGGQYNQEGITEIAIHRFDGRQITDSFISLVNPEMDIQPYVVKMTGINKKMLRNAPKFFEVAKRIIEITKDTVLVAHNASFDYRVLKKEFASLGYDFELPVLCTVELSKALLPEQESYSLGKVCRALGIPVSDRHRANGDALATVELFKLLLLKDGDKKILKESIKTGNARDLSSRLNRLLDKIPHEEGIFYFNRFDKKVIYVGQAKDLRHEVNQRFLQENSSDRKMVKEMQDLSFELTGNSLIGSIRAKEEIKRLRPKYNRLGLKSSNDAKLEASSRQKSGRNSVEFNHPNMILLSKGRQADESSVLLVEDGQLWGYGYVQLNFQLKSMDRLKKLLVKIKANSQYDTLVKDQLDRGKFDKVIRF